jgi:hypothetical protein
MGNLPSARTENCVAGASVSHNLMNEIQDVIISEHASRAADKTKSFTGTEFRVQSGTATVNLIGDIASTAACVLVANIPLAVGDTLKSVSVVFDSGTGTVDVTDFHVSLISSNGTETNLGSTTVSNIGSPVVTPINVTDTVLAANQSFIINISINATGCSVRNFNYTYAPVL